MYLFKENTININLDSIYKKLIQENTLDLNNERLNTYFNNLNKPLNLSREDIKGIYSYIDLENIIQKYYPNNTYDIKESIGHDVIYKTSLPYIVNPYELVSQNTLMDNGETNIITKNKKLLCEFGNVKNNTLYLCLVEDVIKTSDINTEYLIKTYYPQLNVYHNINSLEELLTNRNKLKESIQKNSEKIIGYERKMELLHRLSKKKKI